MSTRQEIRLDKLLNPETKVYRIARQLKEQNKIDPDLWYAILELKDKHIQNIIFEKEQCEV